MSEIFYSKELFRVPKVIIGVNKLVATHVVKDGTGVKIHYNDPVNFPSGHGAVFTAAEVESLFKIFDRESSKTPIVTQGKYECSAASLAMVLDIPLFDVKRALGKCGWRNDDGGTTMLLDFQAARLLGHDLLWLPRSRIERYRDSIPNAMVAVESINYPGRGHAVAWVNGQILDPNTGSTGRKTYGVEWSPWTINTKAMAIKLPWRLSEVERKILDQRRWNENFFNLVDSLLEHLSLVQKLSCVENRRKVA